MGKSRLGKGVDALISGTSFINNQKTQNNNERDNIKYININYVSPKKNQPRKHFDEDKLLELSESIKQHGILEPIIVSQKDDYYEIIAGERRFRAAKKIGLKEIPIIVKNLDEQEIFEISLIENIQRENLNPIEEAMAYDMLVNKFHMKQDEIAQKVSKSRTVITNSLRMLKLSKEVQQMIIDERLTVGHARTLIVINDEKIQFDLANKIIDLGLTVRKSEIFIKKFLNNSENYNKVKDKKLKNQNEYNDVEKKLLEYLNTKVVINRKSDDKGKIEIEYYSNDELDRLIDLIIK